ncbi:MAG: VWA domain-containing protein [Proteobacteria bacterium]|nr:VWA domain-containing protein [Pseudomonadota bacterium]
MDEAQLKQILREYEVPAADDNAKKRAVNLALAEFDAAEKKGQKKFQGIPLLGRLMGSSTQKQRRTPMNRRLVYGGMATAMAVVLVCGISAQQIATRGYDKVMPDNIAGLESETFAPRKEHTAAQNKKEDLLRSRESDLRGGDSLTATERPESKNEFRTAVREKILPSAPAPMMRPPAESNVMAMDSIAGGRAAQGTMMYATPAIGIIDGEIIDPGYYRDAGRDQFGDFDENRIKTVGAEPVSTFSVDVDTVSYSFVRRQLNAGVLPQKDAVRVEEMINYFDYDYPLPETKEQPFRPSVTVIPSPWKEGNKLVHIGIKGYDIDADAQPRSNLVFLLDVSGSMNSPDKLPLLINSMKMLLDTLKPDDTVGIVVYAGAAGTVLEPTKVSDKAKILSALDNLSAGGGTAGAEGIRQAYQLAESGFDKEAVNRVILATDGDFNIGITNPEELKDFIERKRESGVFLSVLGFGQGNLNDRLMQELAQNGNGVAAYIDNLNEARKALVEEATSTLFPIAKDVKIQVEFNPATVAEYRLVGYETRHLNREDFNYDAVDAGDIGAGHSVTAIYEITLVGSGLRAVDDSRYAPAEQAKADANFSDEYAFLKIRYKLPDEDASKLITTPVTMENERRSLAKTACGPAENCLPDANDDVRFSIAVASFGQMLKGGKYVGAMTYDDVINMAQNGKGADEFGYRSEFIQLARLAKSAAVMEKQ